MAGTTSQSSAFRITVLEGPLSTTIIQPGLAQGQINLVGRSLPYQPISYEVMQREKTTYNPGNPVATQQVFGAIDSPTTITGKWKDTFLGNGVARQFVDIFEALCRSGSLIQVAWGDGNIDDGSDDRPAGQIGSRSPYVRRGILKRFKWTPDRPQDIAWEAEFRWRGRDENAAPPTFNLGQINPGQAISQATDIFGNTNDAVLGFTESPLAQYLQFPQQIASQINAGLDSVEIAIDGLRGFVGALVTTAQIPIEAANRITGLLSLVISQYDLIKFSVLDLKAEALIVTDQGLQELLFVSDRLDLLQGIDVAVDNAISQQNSIDGMVLPNIQAEVRPPAGTDLRVLAQQYYGDPDLWWQIAQANNLSSSRVPDGPTGPSDNPGAPLLIPAINQGAIGDLSTALSSEGT